MAAKPEAVLDLSSCLQLLKAVEADGKDFCRALMKAVWPQPLSLGYTHHAQNSTCGFSRWVGSAQVYPDSFNHPCVLVPSVFPVRPLVHLLFPSVPSFLIIQILLLFPVEGD